MKKVQLKIKNKTNKKESAHKIKLICPNYLNNVAYSITEYILQSLRKK